MSTDKRHLSINLQDFFNKGILLASFADHHSRISHRHTIGWDGLCHHCTGTDHRAVTNTAGVQNADAHTDIHIGADDDLFHMSPLKVDPLLRVIEFMAVGCEGDILCQQRIVAKFKEDALSINLHSSIDGTVYAVNEKFITIRG